MELGEFLYYKGGLVADWITPLDDDKYQCQFDCSGWAEPKDIADILINRLNLRMTHHHTDAHMIYFVNVIYKAG